MLQISTVIGAALPSERAQNGWTEGVAIWVAVIIVSLVGEPTSFTSVTIHGCVHSAPCSGMRCEACVS